MIASLMGVENVARRTHAADVLDLSIRVQARNR